MINVTIYYPYYKIFILYFIMSIQKWENDDIIALTFNSDRIKNYNKNCWYINLDTDFENKSYIEFDNKPLYIDMFYTVDEINKYFNLENSLIMIYEGESDISSTNDIYHVFEKTTLKNIENDGNGLFMVEENKLYFSTKNNTNPLENKMKYKLILNNIYSQANNVSDSNFTFGLNWLDFVNERINEKIIESSLTKINEWFDNGNLLKGKNVIDIGCGSGLHSLNLGRYSKSITSLDVDENCIKSTKLLKEKYSQKYNINNWEIIHKSILDSDVIKLPKYDIVYSWGVLHHTGNMWQAIDNAAKLCKDNGILFITLYSAYEVYFPTLIYKLKFNNASKFQKIKMISDRVMLAKHRQKDNEHWNRLTSRGMNVYNDIVDWCGGYPYEVATTELICKYLEPKGFKIIKKYDPSNKACHEWMLQKI